MIHSQSTSHTLQMAFFWDHEEIGSMSSVGADSPFAHQLLERICAQCHIDREDYYRLQSRSLCLSADLAHGFNPNYPEKYDAANAPFLGKGVVFKFNANQKYATNSLTAAALSILATEQKIPSQTFASRSDVPCGSTVGPLMGAHLGIPTIDLGIAGWAMHSAREVIAAEDELSLCRFMKAVCEHPPIEVQANEQ
jgi:aspartyl aminopeptidase